MNFRLIFLVVTLSLCLSPKLGSSQIIQIDLFNQFKIKTLVVIPVEGKYQLITEKGRVDKLKKNTIIYFTYVGDSVSVWDADEHIGLYSKIQLIGTTKNNFFKVEPVYPSIPSRFYEGDITIESENNSLQVKNFVSIDDYLAGVVEAEAGPNAPQEFYKVQAIISRTYLFEIINRSGKNYRVGDDVNFQVYKGMCRQNLNIKLAVTQTRDLVIIDSTQQLITAAFHSNSGGYTANSEDVWLTSTNYLKETSDPYSLNQRNTHWVDSVKLSDWLSYFTQKGFNLMQDSNKYLITHINQTNRIKYLNLDQDSIAFKQIRKDFGLRSAWFNTEPKEQYIIIRGLGYGHGVGLSQEGGMQMARQNYSFLDIIYYYYKNVKVIHINKL